MSNAEALPSPKAGLLQDLKDSRSRSAVLKTQLVVLKSSLRSPTIFVFEGPEDKTIYHHWICKINYAQSYESFVCNGKSQVLKLFSAVERDVNDLGVGVYFFIDKDFDSLQEHPASQKIFLTEAYSVENYLVRSETVLELLKSHFHYLPDIALRTRLVDLFDQLYLDFLTVTSEINFRSFACRHLKIDAVPGLPKKLNKLAAVELDRISPVGDSPENIIMFRREPSQVEVDVARVEFAKLIPKRDYRGKYAMMFLMRWLDLLVRDRNSDDSKFFNGVKTADAVATINLDCVASRSVIPPGLHEFLEAVRAGN
ncbi:DUF4435 domain-containing protein [Pseudomonas sp. 18175]|uniref:DUF4435 domain-containing protein n=1 Tax=Pseudomonas sp. 18175 TaxID=3390056 RepID=UPI003D1BE000